jgi:hypothetical protein
VRDYIVKDLMVPISEYATVPEGSTLFEAVLALEAAQESYQQNRYSHRAVLIWTKTNGLWVNSARWIFCVRWNHAMTTWIRSESSIVSGSPGKPLPCNRKNTSKVRPRFWMYIPRRPSMNVADFMQRPTEGEYVDENTRLDMALHQLTAGSNLSLLVTRGADIVGVLRLSDVFAAVFHAMKESETQQSDGATE